jgi:predicted TIM-barrel fold metal-dependent hydrolase
MRTKEAMPALDALRLFDSCLTLGRVVHSQYPESLTVDTALALMDRYHIAEALAHEHDARLIHPRERANRRLLDEVAGQPRLHPVWVIEPPKSPGADAARALVATMLDSGVRAARLPMRASPPLLWLWEDLCAALEEHHVPCFLDFGGISTSGEMSDGDVNGVREIALAHPELPMILSHLFGGLGIHPAVVPLVRRTRNLFLDITGILEFWREVALGGAPERVLFATGAPFADPGIYVSNVQYELRLDEAAKRQIAGDNLRRLLEAVR